METTIINIIIPPAEPVSVVATMPPPEPVTVISEEITSPVSVTVTPPAETPVNVEVQQPAITEVVVNVSSIGERGPEGPPGDLVSDDLLFGETPAGAVNGSNATFTSLLPFIPDKLSVFINGLLQKPVTHYQTAGIDTIIFSDSPQPPDIILLNYIKS